MAERVKDEHLQQRILAPNNLSEESKRLESASGERFRIDSAHLAHAELSTREVEWQELEHSVPAKRMEPAAPASLAEAAPTDTSLLDEFTERFRRKEGQIHAQKAILVQREQALREQQTVLENEHKQITHQLALEHAQLDAKKNQFQKENAAFAERLIQFEIQSREFDSDYQTFQRHKAELDRERKSLREDLLAEMQSEQSQLDDAKAALQKDLDHVQTLNGVLQSRLQSLAEENAQTLKTEREKLWQTLTEEWDERRIAFERDEQDWIETRDSERSDLEREKAMFESAVDSANKQFLKLQSELAEELTQRRRQHEQQLETERQEWDEHRRRGEEERVSQAQARQAALAELREALILEFENHREELASKACTERDEWEKTLRREQSELATEKAELEELKVALEREFLASREENATAIRDAQEAWEQHRDRENAKLNGEHAKLIEACDVLMRELFDRRSQHDAQIAAERDEWEQTRQRQKDEFDTQQADWVASRDAMLQASRDALEVEFISLREQNSARLQTEQDESQQLLTRENAQYESRRAEFLRERTLIENRIRFQQEHLDKSRIELEQAQNEYRRERQAERQHLVDANMLMLRRLKQIDLYRSSIDAREKSLDREHEVFTRTRIALSSTADLDRLNFQAEKHAWEQERQIQQQELRRQQEVLATRAEGLESRRARLDKLRSELEETHRTTLEMRLAVEEAWAQFSQMAGSEDARERVEQVRQSLMGYYQQMHESMADQRREHLDAQAKFDRTRAEFAEERQKLTTWITSRDDELRVGEERLRIASGDAADNHTKWLAARDQWLVEKTEAEHLIRRLLTSLGDNTRSQSVDPELILGLDEIHGHRDDAFSKLRGGAAEPFGS